MTPVTERDPLTAGQDRDPRAMDGADGMTPEPATPRALWPTFMRRTLAEDALRAPQRPLPLRPTLPEA